MQNNKLTIGMCHLLPLPGEPNFDFSNGIESIYKHALADITILQECGFSAVLVSNEFGYPYCDKVDTLTKTAMAYIVGRLKNEIKIPFGIDCMYDPFATIDIALISEADFVRITLNKTDKTDYLLGSTDIGSLIRRLSNYKTSSYPEMLLDISIPLGLVSTTHNKNDFINCIMRQIAPFAICISNDEIQNIDYKAIKSQYNNLNILCDGGCNKENIIHIINKVDGIVIGTALKKDEIITNKVDYRNTKDIINLINRTTTNG